MDKQYGVLFFSKIPRSLSLYCPCFPYCSINHHNALFFFFSPTMSKPLLLGLILFLSPDSSIFNLSHITSLTATPFYLQSLLSFTWSTAVIQAHSPLLTVDQIWFPYSHLSFLTSIYTGPLPFMSAFYRMTFLLLKKKKKAARNSIVLKCQ